MAHRSGRPSRSLRQEATAGEPGGPLGSDIDHSSGANLNLRDISGFRPLMQPSPEYSIAMLAELSLASSAQKIPRSFRGGRTIAARQYGRVLANSRNAINESFQ